MICYRCGNKFPDDQPFYNDYEVVVCKPCFLDAQRCFICRFPGKELREVAGLGLECEFCRGKVVAEGDTLAESLPPIAAFLSAFGCRVEAAPRFEWRDLSPLRDMQTNADLPKEAFFDDFLRHAYPVYYRDGSFHLLRRMPRPTFVVHMIVQLAVAHVAGAYRLPNLAGKTAFHAFAQGWCHWIGYTAANALKFDREQRQLRKWPELGMQGDFERWEKMAKSQQAPKVSAHFHATVVPLARTALTDGEPAYQP
jgi:hypothetical protein